MEAKAHLKKKRTRTKARKRLEFELARRRVEERRIENVEREEGMGQEREEPVYEMDELRSPPGETYEYGGQEWNPNTQSLATQIITHPRTRALVNRFFPPSEVNEEI